MAEVTFAMVLARLVRGLSARCHDGIILATATSTRRGARAGWRFVACWLRLVRSACKRFDLPLLTIN